MKVDIHKLLRKIKNKTAKVGIIGVGYVGEALVRATTAAGFSTIGFDIDQKRIKLVNSYKIKNFYCTNKSSKLLNFDILCVCVPTPVNQNKKPDLSQLRKALQTIAKFLKKGRVVIIESSIAPGTTRNFVLPILGKSNLKVGVDFFLAYSPERIDPGNLQFGLKNTPKVVGGLERNSLNLAVEFYSQFVEKVVPASSLEVAEMTKVLENTFRLVNISLINEIKAYTDLVGVDIWEVIEAASTKPFGFLAHHPGPGVGGHCIPVLPYHLIDSAKKQRVLLRIVESAAVVNEIQPEIVAKKTVEVVNGKLKNGENLKVLLIGVSYKPETADIRESPALKIWELLEREGLSVSYHDPHVPTINGFSSQRITNKSLEKVDFVIITTAHKNIPYTKLIASGKLIIDTRNILKSFANSNILRV